MSYILDALQKSEAERNRDRPPDLSTVHAPASRRRPVPTLALAALGIALAANAAVLGYWLSRTPPAEPIPMSAAPADAAAVEATGALAAQAPAGAAPAAGADAHAAPPPAAESQPGGGSAAAPLPVAALPEAVRARIPRLEFSTHIYASDAELREVRINGRRYREGERIDGGPRLVRITEDGVILALEGWTFTMGVLQDWRY